MSQIDFALLTHDYPHLDSVWEFLRAWIDSHPTTTLIPVSRLATANTELSALDLASALDLLAKRGFATVVYIVREPDGTYLTENRYAQPSEIPDRIRGRFHSDFYDRQDVDIEPAYELEGVGGE